MKLELVEEQLVETTYKWNEASGYYARTDADADVPRAHRSQPARACGGVCPKPPIFPKANGPF